MDHETTTPNQDQGEFAYLWAELGRRTKVFPKRVPFFAYVLVAIIGLGGLGIWAELVRMALSTDNHGFDRVFTAAATFYPAVIGSATFQLLLIATGRLDKIIAAFGIFVLVFSIGAAVLLALFRSLYPVSSLVAAILLVGFAIWIWIVANADDPIFKGDPGDAPSGGNTTRPLKGNLGDFKAD